MAIVLKSFILFLLWDEVSGTRRPWIVFILSTTAPAFYCVRRGE